MINFNDIVEIGYAIPTLYMSPRLTRGQLNFAKRLIFMYVWFDNTLQYFAVNDVNTAAGQQVSDLLNILYYNIDANIATLFDNDELAQVAENVYRQLDVNLYEKHNAYKESLQGVGGSVQFAVYSTYDEYWVLGGYEFDERSKKRGRSTIGGEY